MLYRIDAAIPRENHTSTITWSEGMTADVDLSRVIAAKPNAASPATPSTSSTPATRMVTRLDRVARATRDLLNTLATVTGRKAGFRSLGDTWADTTTPHGRFMLIALGSLAEFERELIRARTTESRSPAIARGVKLGRKPKVTPHQVKEAIRRRGAGDETVRDIARSYNVSLSTISRLGATL